jgi:ElaB/YqjD/DUF883 family membrane-anchored ribosome-binding protein
MSGLPPIPPPKLPRLGVPQIRSLPQLPNVGCAPGNATSFVGNQFGNLPDLNAVLQIRALKKALEEQIYALIDGQLPQIARAPRYAQRAAQVTQQVAQLVAALNQILAAANAEAQAAVAAVNSKIGEVNTAKNDILSIPESARSTAQRRMLMRYNEYVGELNGQIARLESTLGCLS